MSVFRPTMGVILFLVFGQVLANPARIENVRIATKNEVTRVVLDLSQPSDHQVFTLSDPYRIVIDIKPGFIGANATSLPTGKGSVRRIRSANRQDGTARIVLDLNARMQPRSFLLEPGSGQGDRLVIDLFPGDQPAPVKTARAVKNTARDIVIVVDPGHGGKDPGSIGSSGLREKDAVLKISKRLAEKINNQPGMRAILTRSDDRLLDHRVRTEKARSAEADLFVSIHADSFKDRRVNGATVYVLSNKGASDEASMRLAERENAAHLIGGVDLGEKDQVLASVLMDLSQNASLSSSIQIGDEILREMAFVGKVRKRNVLRAPFLVLKAPDVPSVLIETAYISNAKDERNLGSRVHQDKLAQAIFSGIRSYYYANPPRGTLVAQLSKKSSQAATAHKVRSGETLSKIAGRYKVSVRRIRAANNLRTDKIVVGKILTIPAASGI